MAVATRNVGLVDGHGASHTLSQAALPTAGGAPAYRSFHTTTPNNYDLQFSAKVKAGKQAGPMGG